MKKQTVAIVILLSVVILIFAGTVGLIWWNNGVTMIATLNKDRELLDQDTAKATGNLNDAVNMPNVSIKKIAGGTKMEMTINSTYYYSKVVTDNGITVNDDVPTQAKFPTAIVITIIVILAVYTVIVWFAFVMMQKRKGCH